MSTWKMKEACERASTFLERFLFTLKLWIGSKKMGLCLLASVKFKMLKRRRFTKRRHLLCKCNNWTISWPSSGPSLGRMLFGFSPTYINFYFGKYWLHPLNINNWRILVWIMSITYKIWCFYQSIILTVIGTIEFIFDIYILYYVLFIFTSN
jgi:hypothetical protein